MTQYADADMLLAMYTFENDNELKELNERGHVPAREPWRVSRSVHRAKAAKGRHGERDAKKLDNRACGARLQGRGLQGRG